MLLKGVEGVVTVGGDSARAVLLHDSPDDQELIEVQLLDDFICLEAGEKTQFQRHQFRKGVMMKLTDPVAMLEYMHAKFHEVTFESGHWPVALLLHSEPHNYESGQPWDIETGGQPLNCQFYGADSGNGNSSMPIDDLHAIGVSHGGVNVLLYRKSFEPSESLLKQYKHGRVIHIIL